MITVDEFLDLKWHWEAHWPKIESMRYGDDVFVVRHDGDIHYGYINGHRVCHADNMERTVRRIYAHWRREKVA
jgi:hypothetical protein